MTSIRSWYQKHQNTCKLPLICGHRGARGEMPENTMPGFYHLVKHGVMAVEIDIQNTADAIPVLHHDPRISENLARDSNGRWLDDFGPKIIESPYDEIMHFDVGALRPGTAYQRKFPDQLAHEGLHIPTLEEFCIWLKSYPQMLANIEIKSYADRQDLSDSPMALANSVTNVIINHDLMAQVIISSFDWRVLSACRAIDERVILSFLTYMDRENPIIQPNIFHLSPWMDGAHWNASKTTLPDVIADMGGHVWAPYFGDLSTFQITRAKDLGLIVNVWPVNCRADILRMIEFEVDGLITDFPARVKKIFSDYGSQQSSPRQRA